ncbi:MAG: ThiF family adenylyltransferase [Lachnospiraceae bacterium]|nr:ThiF family adenylyltransferase [Lachnospiraceae bacterium]
MNKHKTPVFDLRKLPEYTETFADRKVGVIGGGAVGSLAVESLVKMGCKDILIIDFDRLEPGNISKSSSMYRYPDDLGKNKAVALAARANEILTDNSVHGIDADISDFGPMAFAGFDVVILALDNYAAKIYFNQIWKQIPALQRPILISGGTYEEIAQSNCLDGNEACLRCTFDESWLERPLERTSCLIIQFRVDPLRGDIVRTSGLASQNAAHLMSEQCRSYFLGYKNVQNKRLMYYPYPNIGLNEYIPMKRGSCPDCRNYQPAEACEALPDTDVLNTTIGELMSILEELFSGRNFELLLPVVEYAGVGYTGLIKSAHCVCCGAEIDNIYRHPFRTRPGDIICGSCRTKGKTAPEHLNISGDDGVLLGAITRENCDGILAEKTLYEAGFAIGSFIEVRLRDDTALDIMDGGFETKLFYCENDRDLLKSVNCLNPEPKQDTCPESEEQI